MSGIVLFVIFSAVGVHLAVIGFFVWRFNKYYWIAGVNTATPEERAKMDLPAITNVVGRTLMALGPGWVIAGGLFALGVEAALYVFIALFVVVVFAMILRVQRLDGNQYDESGKRKKGVNLPLYVSMVFAGVVMLFVGIALVFSALEPAITVDGAGIKVDCIFGCEVARADIASCRLVQELPGYRRTYGGDVMGALKGRFSLEGIGKARVYAQRDCPPYILLDTAQGYLLLGHRDAEQTMVLYGEIQEAIR